GELAALPAVDPALVTALEEAVRPADDLAVLFTSGSRGVPKGVIHTHGGGLRAVASGLDARCVRQGERLYVPMPFFWTGGVRPRPALGARGRGHAAHRGRPRAGADAAPPRAGAGHAVPRLAGPGRSPRLAPRVRVDRPVEPRPGQPRPRAPRRAAARTGREG